MRLRSQLDPDIRIVRIVLWVVVLLNVGAFIGSVWRRDWWTVTMTALWVFNLVLQLHQIRLQQERRDEARLIHAALMARFAREEEES